MNPLFERARERGVNPKTLIMLERFEERIAIDPQDSNAYAQLGDGWISRREYGKGVENLDTALEFDPNNTHALRCRASLRSTCPDSKFRNGSDAMRDIMRAIGIENANGKLNGDWLHRLYLRICAAAHAELGEYDDAVAVATEAIELSITKLSRDKVKREIAQYEECEPYRNTIC